MYTQKSFRLKSADADKKWHLIDAQDLIVGRLATEIANLLRGKYNPQYTPNTDSGDFVVVVNADKVRFTGRKLDQKTYYRHSSYVGGLKSTKAEKMLEEKPERVLEYAVKGMLPKNSLGRKMLTKLKIYSGSEHNNAAQNPQKYEVRS